MTSQASSAPSIEAAARIASPIPGSSASAAASGSPLAPSAIPIIAVVDRVEADAGGLGLGHERADDVVGGTERDPAPDQAVRHGRGGRVALGRGRAHPLRVDGHRLEHPREHAQRGLVDRHRVEQRRLVLLEVALVGQRQALEHREDARSAPR